MKQRNLRGLNFDSQLSFRCDNEGNFMIRYKEDIGLKTNKGGLKHTRVQPKQVDMYLIKNIHWCPIRIILKYLSLVPKGGKCTSFYLNPKKNYSPNVWFCDRPVGVNRLKKFVKNLCIKGGIPGYFTNHSLRSTCATKLYREEQV